MLDDMQSFQEYQLPEHILGISELLVQEELRRREVNSSGPLLEFFLSNNMFETLIKLAILNVSSLQCLFGFLVFWFSLSKAETSWCSQVRDDLHS